LRLFLVRDPERLCEYKDMLCYQCCQKYGQYIGQTQTFIDTDDLRPDTEQLFEHKNTRIEHWINIL